MNYFYDYLDWVEWPEAGIEEYAREIADDYDLTEDQAKYLTRQMLMEAGHWPPRRIHRVDYPTKLGPDQEALLREVEGADERIDDFNRALNRPEEIRGQDATEFRLETLGKGLTRRKVRSAQRMSRHYKREVTKFRKRTSRMPFSQLRPQIRAQLDQAMWLANCYPIEYDNWLVPKEARKPYDGVLWYAEQIERGLLNAKRQAEMGNSEAALWHAYNVGILHAELGLKTAHGEKFDKYEAVQEAQRSAGRSSKRVSDELRRSTYAKYRARGDKKTEAGRAAAQELGLSEASIRNAFPDGCYPPE